MIVLDIETSGMDFLKCGIWQIGAIDLENPENQFLEESRIDDEDIVTESAKKITGKTETELRDVKKQSQKQLLKRFFEWCEKAKVKNFICQNPQFDTTFLILKAKKYDLKYPFHYRTFDLHSIASLKYKQIKGNFLIDKDHSDMSLDNTLKFCGIEDIRIKMENGKVVKEGASA